MQPGTQAAKWLVGAVPQSPKRRKFCGCAPFRRLRNLRKMAIDGYVIKLELPELKEMIRLLGIANNNINQIARSLNSTGRIYEADIQEIRDRIDGLYDYARKILDSLSKIT